MELQVFSVFDSAANAFMEPFFSPTLETALRGFRQICQKEGHQFNQFPQDYSLFHLGTFYHASGEIVPLATPHSLGVAVTFLKPQLESGNASVG